MNHIKRLNEMVESDKYDWASITSDPTLMVDDGTSIHDITAGLARHCTGYNSINLPSPEDVSAVVDFLDRNFGKTDEFYVAKFIATFFWHAGLLKSRGVNARYRKIWNNYLKSHPGTELETFRKINGD